MGSVEVKICGIARRADAEVAARAGARFGGVILAPGGKRSVTARNAADLFVGLPLRPVGVFVDSTADEIARAAEIAGLEVIQLHGNEPVETIRLLRGRGEWTIWKALRPRSTAELIDGMHRYAGAVDGLLMDGWSDAAPGGTGSLFPWEVLAAERARFPEAVALIVAGGLSPDNVADAVELLRPSVVDVSSGVEHSPGVKDPEAVLAFVTAATRAASERAPS